MLNGNSLMLPFLLALGVMLLSIVQSQADEKKKEEKKSVSQFKGAGAELKMKDGKATFKGELTDDDPVVRNHYYKVFTVKLEAGKTYRIDYKETRGYAHFHAFLFLEDANANTLANNNY